MLGSSAAFEIASAPYGAQPQPPLTELEVREVERDRLQVAMKRALDVVFSLALLLLLSPLMLSVMLLIRSTSPGPALFRQRRVGLKGKSFEIYKFRSMVESAESLREFLETHNERPDGPTFKMRRDPRVTTVGRFIRRFSIDELPQFLNVLRGDMSLVGPRPPIPSEVRRYESWQLTPNRCALDFTEWVQLDLAYIEGWHLGRDLLLIARTVPAVLTGRDQY
jgi:lipopolysaccharide/colanic/teichoic acid biosynthesis glycosyltransferase